MTLDTRYYGREVVLYFCLLVLCCVRGGPHVASAVSHCDLSNTFNPQDQTSLTVSYISQPRARTRRARDTSSLDSETSIEDIEEASPTPPEPTLRSPPRSTHKLPWPKIPGRSSRRSARLIHSLNSLLTILSGREGSRKCWIWFQLLRWKD